MIQGKGGVVWCDECVADSMPLYKNVTVLKRFVIFYTKWSRCKKLSNAIVTHFHWCSSNTTYTTYMILLGDAGNVGDPLRMERVGQ